MSFSGKQRVIALVVALGLILAAQRPTQAGGFLESVGKGFADFDSARLEIMGAKEPPQIIVPNFDGLYFNNKTGEWIKYAVMFYTPANLTVGAESSAAWTVTGWSAIPPGKTHRVLFNLANRYVYYYAESHNHIWSGNTDEMVTNVNFTYNRLSTPPGKLPGYVHRKFIKIDTQNAKRYFLNLTSTVPLALKGGGTPPVKTINATFTNNTNKQVRFHLSGGKGLDTNLAAKATTTFKVIVDPGVTPTVSISQGNGLLLPFTLANGGKYQFLVDGGKIKNFLK